MLRPAIFTVSLALMAAPAFAHNPHTLSAPEDMSANETPAYTTADSAYRGDPNSPADTSTRPGTAAAQPIVVTEVVKPAEKATEYVTQTTTVDPNAAKRTWANTPAGNPPAASSTQVIVPAGSSVTVPAKGMPATTTIQVQ